MLPVNRDPSRSQVRVFAFVIFGGLGLIGLLLWYRGLPRPAGYRPADWGWTGSAWHIAALTLWAIGTAAVFLCLLSRRLGRVIYVVWMTGSTYIGAVMSTFMLTVLFIALLPVFSLIRLKDPLRLKLRDVGSYWEDPSPHEATTDRMRRPF